MQKIALLVLAAGLAGCETGKLSPQFTEAGRWESVGSGQVGSIQSQNSLEIPSIQRGRGSATATFQIVATNHDLPWGGRVAHIDAEFDCVGNRVDFLSMRTYTAGGTLTNSLTKAQMSQTAFRAFTAPPGTSWFRAIRRACG